MIPRSSLSPAFSEMDDLFSLRVSHLQFLFTSLRSTGALSVATSTFNFRCSSRAAPYRSSPRNLILQPVIRRCDQTYTRLHHQEKAQESGKIFHPLRSLRLRRLFGTAFPRFRRPSQFKSFPPFAVSHSATGDCPQPLPEKARWLPGHNLQPRTLSAGAKGISAGQMHPFSKVRKLCLTMPSSRSERNNGKPPAGFRKSMPS